MINAYYGELLELFLAVQSETDVTLTRYQLRRYEQYQHSYRVVRLDTSNPTNALVLASKLVEGELYALVAKVSSGEWVE